MNLGAALKSTFYLTTFFAVSIPASSHVARAETVSAKIPGGFISVGCTNSKGQANGTSAYLPDLKGLNVENSYLIASDRFIPDLTPQGYKQTNNPTLATLRIAGTVQEQYRINGSVRALIKQGKGYAIITNTFAARANCDPPPRPDNIAQPPSNTPPGSPYPVYCTPTWQNGYYCPPNPPASAASASERYLVASAIAYPEPQTIVIEGTEPTIKTGTWQGHSWVQQSDIS